MKQSWIKTALFPETIVVQFSGCLNKAIYLCRAALQRKYSVFGHNTSCPSLLQTWWSYPSSSWKCLSNIKRMVFLAVLSWLFVCLNLDDTRNLEWEVPAIPILCTHMLKGSENMRKKQAISFPTAFSLIMGWLSNWLFSTESFSSKNDDLFCLSLPTVTLVLTWPRVQSEGREGDLSWHLLVTAELLWSPG